MQSSAVPSRSKLDEMDEGPKNISFVLFISNKIKVKNTLFNISISKHWEGKMCNICKRLQIR